MEAIKSNTISVLLFVESRYKVSRKRIKETIQRILKANGVQGPAEVSVAVVGDRKMRALHKKYKGEDRTTNVLSFSLTEGDVVVTNPGILRLGDIILSYPQVIRESAKEEMLVDDKVDQLIEHSTYHLLGIHH